MNICFYGRFTGGGTESATYLLANELSQNHTVFILNTALNKPSFFLENQVIYESMSKSSNLQRILSLRRFLVDSSIDVLVSVEALTGIISVPAARWAGCKHIIWEHANYFQNQNSRWIQKVRQLELLLADAYVVLTKRDKENFKQHFKVKTKLEAIYNIANTQGDHTYDYQSKHIMSAGHIRKVKNFSIIPEIAKVVFSKHSDWQWIIYGDTSGLEYEKIIEKIKAYQLENHVIFPGRHDELQAAYQQASMYVMTSLQEGLPMVLLEAKSHKLPLVSFDIETGPDEIIQDGINGFLVPAYSVEVMSEKICYLIENVDERILFSNQSQQGLERFSKDKVSKAWEDLLIAI